MPDVGQVPESVKPRRPPLAYPDVIQAWLKRPLNQAKALALRRTNGFRTVRIEDIPAPFLGGYVQRVRLRQVKAKAILILIEHEPYALINQIELALDLNYRTAHEAQQAFTFILQRVRTKGRHHIQDLGNGRRRFYGGTGKASVVLKAYDNKPCRIDGSPYCLHVEWVARRRIAVERFGVHFLQDLIGFDHEAFWVKRWVLQEVVFDKLGRMLDNHQRRDKRRNGNDMDALYGKTFCQMFGTSQELAQALKEKGMRSERVLVKVGIKELLGGVEDGLKTFHRVGVKVRTYCNKGDVVSDERVDKLLAMLSSSFDGEVLNAARMLAKMAKDKKLTIPELVKNGTSVSVRAWPEPPPWAREPPRPRRPPPPPPRPQMDLVARLREALSGDITPLSDWELDFADSIVTKHKTAKWLSEKQRIVVERVVDKLEDYQ